jgi:hypothetical protein
MPRVAPQEQISSSTDNNAAEKQGVGYPALVASDCVQHNDITK